MAIILDGKGLAAQIRQGLKARVEALKGQRGVTPGLAAILVGEDPASKIYVNTKARACQEVGIFVRQFLLEGGIEEGKLMELIEGINTDERFHGILVQLPLPPGIDKEKVLGSVNPQKDVDGFHPLNLGRLFMGQPYFYPCTPYGIVRLLDHYGIEIEGKVAVVVGRSLIVGRPLAAMLLNRNATVIICHTRTKELSRWTREADILVAAAGRPQMIKGDMIKEGVVVVDVGINRMPDGKLVGDVDFPSAFERASAITPVPGGVGPMTVAMLLSNTVDSTERLT